MGDGKLTGSSVPNPDPNIKLVTVFRTADLGRASFAESLLQDARIDYFIRGGTLRGVMCWNEAGTFSSALGLAEFQVREGDASDALKLLEPLNEHESDG